MSSRTISIHLVAWGLCVLGPLIVLDAARANDDCDHDNDGLLSTLCGGFDCDDNGNGFIDDWDIDGLIPRICGGTDCYDGANACRTDCLASACDPYCDVDGDGFPARICGGNDCNDNEADCGYCWQAGCNDCGAYSDADGDGHASILCGEDDCDDGNPNRYPGNAEVCDTAGLDEDCDPSTFGFRDADGDGAFDALCCNGPNCGTDCDDNDPQQHYGNVEVCDYKDNDCDGTVDEGPSGSQQILGYVDQDGDGWGAGSGASRCLHDLLREKRASRNGDCADADHARNPGAREICNGLDDDCDGAIDEGC